MLKYNKHIRFFFTLFTVLLFIGNQTRGNGDITREKMENTPVSITIDEGEVASILQLLAAQNDFNLSIASDIEGRVSLALTDISLANALDVIASSVGANWYISGNIIVIKSAEREYFREMQTRIFRLEYLPSSEALKLVESIEPEKTKTEALSRSEETEGGWDEIIQVTSYPYLLDRIESILSELDKPRPQVEIEAKILETVIRDDSKLGIDFPDNFSARLGDMDDELEVDGSLTKSLNSAGWTWGRMTISEVTTLLDVLIKNGQSKLISNPRVTTTSNQKAFIEVTTTIPVQTLNRFSEGGIIQDIVSFQDLDVSIELEVTPRVSDDSMIVLDVTSKVEEITGYTGPQDNLRPVTSRRSVTSKVTVANGESLGLGGLMKETEYKNIKKMPVLGYIPIIGKLFEHHSTNKEKSELIILITPRIVSPIK